MPYFARMSSYSQHPSSPQQSLTSFMASCDQSWDYLSAFATLQPLRCYATPLFHFGCNDIAVPVSYGMRGLQMSCRPSCCQSALTASLTELALNTCVMSSSRRCWFMGPAMSSEP